MIKRADRFPASSPRAHKRSAGATDVGRTPLALRVSGMTISDGLSEYIRQRLSAKLGKFADRIERLSVRFEDQNGPRGGVDIVCRAKVVLSGIPSVVVDGRAETDRQAFGEVLNALERTVRRSLGRAGRTRGKPARANGDAPPKKPSKAAAPVHPADEGSLIGRRVGRGAANLRAALLRPEKLRRDLPVDTAAVGVSATDRKAGGGSTARRNSKARAPRATATLEDSQQDRPSRKSTRKSANRAKSATLLQRRAIAKTTSSTARARRSRVRTAQKP